MSSLRESKWKYLKSGGTGISLDNAGGGWGIITLASPEGAPVDFKYTYVVAGPSWGLENFKDHTLGTASSTPDSWSLGKIYILGSFRRSELRTEDIAGFFQIVDLSVIGILGISGTAILLGPPETGALSGVAATAFMNADKIGMSALSSNKNDDFVWGGPKALLVTAAQTSGPSVGIGFSQGIGYLSVVETPAVETPTFDVPTPVNTSPTRTISSAYETTLELPADVLFAFNHYDLSPAARPFLIQAGNKIKSQPGSFVVIKGHTDDVGGDVYNVGLSIRRALTVSQWLVSKGYVDSAHVHSVGVGKKEPAVPKFDEESRRRNRRVEIQIFSRERPNFNPR